MTSWHEDAKPAERDPWGRFAFLLIALAVPIMFLGGFLLLDWLLRELAKVIA